MGLRPNHKTRIINAVATIKQQAKELLSVVEDPNFASAKHLQHALVFLPLSTIRTTLNSLQQTVTFLETVISKIDTNLDRLEAEDKARDGQKPGMTSYDGTKHPGITKVGGEHGKNN